ncbi:unnamed protein product [Polarella glacialis]|uniref:RNA helicase n=1 Tax=Polarella glacialis TaxID=89957 RepID=A0A813FUT6_POLGL|nr:unnamed protein product [Polarella glacialis]
MAQGSGMFHGKRKAEYYFVQVAGLPRSHIDFIGFIKRELNGRYVSREPSMLINGKPTFWHVDAGYFLYESAQAWAVAGAESLQAISGGAVLGWAMKNPQGHDLTSTSIQSWLVLEGKAWVQSQVTAVVDAEQDMFGHTSTPSTTASYDAGGFSGGSCGSTCPAGRAPFRRDFLPGWRSGDQEADRLRVELCIQLEEDPRGKSSTPAPVRKFSDLACLPNWVQSALRENNWEMPMPVQAQALPVLLSGRSLIGIAQTGSGKTASFLLPAIVHIEDQPPLTRQSPGPVCLVLSPTRELAVQISDEATKLFRFSHQSSKHPGGMRSVAFYGGGRKWEQLRSATYEGPHVCVATPGRLLDFLGEKSISAARVTFLVLDEADRMLDMGFSGDMNTIAAQVRPDRQTAFFSATWPREVQSLACELCSDAPVRIRIGRPGDSVDSNGTLITSLKDGDSELPTARESIKQQVIVFDPADDWRVLEEKKMVMIKAHTEAALLENAESKVLVFVNEKGQVDTLSTDLWKAGFQADGIHSGKKQDSRLSVLEQFRKGEIRVLVATDVLGRGLDIPKVSHVVIHSMGAVDDYVHRIGRTGRGKDGTGHAMVFFEYNWKMSEVSEQLIGVLQRSNQQVPPELVKIAEDVKSGKLKKFGDGKYWGNSWKDKSSGEGPHSCYCCCCCCYCCCCYYCCCCCCCCS